jgi:hypothetical protein
MIRLLRFLITGDWHLHEWVKIKEENRWQRGSEHPYRYDHVCKCNICGKVKTFKGVMD